jgi:hypothetical protein
MTPLQLIELASNLLVIPLFGFIWGVQGRLSRIEAQLEIVLSETERRKVKRHESQF